MNNFELEFEKESAKAIVEVFKGVIEDIVRPSSKSIGKNIGLMFDGAMGWLGCWGEKQKIEQQKSIENFKQNIELKISNISNENLKEPTMNIVGPAIESAKFYYEEKYYKEMFANLIAAACDKSKIDIIHPSYVEIIKQLSPRDAKLLNIFKYNSTYPMVTMNIKHEDGTITPYIQYLFDFKDRNQDFNMEEHSLLTPSLDNLVRLGLIIKNNSIIELNYNYEEFRNNIFYSEFSKIKSSSQDKIEFTKYRLELSNFGAGFVNICF